MEADFSGYATKAGLKCTDGRTIMPDAFKHQDQMQVPLVWQHGHTDPENVLGHVLLENRRDGVYGYGFFNKSGKSLHTKELLEHKDINMMSIWANQLIERAGQVLHGVIREVSLVLSGANPGALIENVTIRHSDGGEDVLDDDFIIYTGLELEHSNVDTKKEDDNMAVKHADGEETVQDVYDSMSAKQQEVVQFMIGQALEDSGGDSMANSAIEGTETEEVKHDDTGEDEGAEGDDTVKAVYESMSDEQKEVVHFMLGEALAHSDDDKVQHADDAEETVQDVYDSMSEKQKQVLHFMIGQALEDAGSAQQDNMNDDTSNTNDQEGTKMTHNVFEKDEKSEVATLSHAEMAGIVADATKSGSLKEAVENYALAHGIENIDVMFPDAKALSDQPEFIRRRIEWVSQLLGATRKSPFTRIKTLSADLTFEGARAKGYIKGTVKKEEFFEVASRVTIPSTIYKKQKIDRDDVIDITDFDVVAWLKAEMRIMLDEEVARAILLGDGREVDDEDKISETNIRPIAKDNELYTTVVTVNIDDTASSVTEIVDALIMNRQFYKGSGLPTMYTTETYIAKFLMLKDSTGRRIYTSLSELATELRVASIMPVEVMEEYPDLVCVLVNPVDYVVGADKGGDVNMFDDFDIDYNQYKYLIETRMSGALVKIKSALVVMKTAGTNVLVAPASPSFVEATGALTIVNQTGVVYKHGVTVLNALGSPYTVPAGQSWTVDATPAAGYYFGTSDDDAWSFTHPA